MPNRRVATWKLAVAVVAGPGVVVGLDAWRMFSDGGPARWISALVEPAGLWTIWLLLGFPLFLLRRAPSPRPLDQTATGIQPMSAWRSALIFALAAIAGYLNADWRAADLAGLPPLYHDEYSYLFQARTFLAGRVVYPSDPDAEFFDQMHVLNDGVFASRYFPGTGAWLAPFVALGDPWLGWRVAHGLIAGFTALSATRFGVLAGLLAGALCATSPILMVLSTLLLSPTPTMLALAVFLWAFYRTFETGRMSWAALAGAAIGFAFVTRPLTAMGLGFPFAFYSVYRLGWRRELVAMVASFAVFIVGLAAYDAAVTGRPSQTPYGRYADRWTPKHQFGFYNRQRATPTPAVPAFIADYDDWADDLTPALALSQTSSRCVKLAQWSEGWAPVAGFAVLAILELPALGDALLLPALGILGLIAAYAPYAFPGILGWGYLFEATPWTLVLTAVGASIAVGDAHARGRPGLAIWWLLLVFAPAVDNCFGPGYLGGVSASAAFAPGSEIVYPRRQARAIAEQERALADRGPILVFYRLAGSIGDSRHATLVHNRPTLDGPILRAWDLGPEKNAHLRARFPERTAYICEYFGWDRPAIWRPADEPP